MGSFQTPIKLHSLLQLFFHTEPYMYLSKSTSQSRNVQTLPYQTHAHQKFDKRTKKTTPQKWKNPSTWISKLEN